MGSVFVRSRPLSKNMHGKCWMHATMLEVRTIPKMQIPSFLASLIFFQNSSLLKQVGAIAAWESLCHFQSPKKSVTRHRRVRSVRSPHRPRTGIPEERRLNDSTTSTPWVGTSSDLVSPTCSQGTGVMNACKVSKPKEISSGLSLPGWLGTRVGEVAYIAYLPHDCL